SMARIVNSVIVSTGKGVTDSDADVRSQRTRGRGPKNRRGLVCVGRDRSGAGAPGHKSRWILIGKDKPSFTPYLDSGDHVVVINADKVRMTGNKVEQKIYYS